MYNTVIKSFILTLGIIFSLVACGDTPESPVQINADESTSDVEANNAEETRAPNETNIADEIDAEHSVVTNALKYIGNDARGRTCDLYVSILETEHGAHQHHEIVTKVDYTTLDGHGTIPGESQFYQYKSSTGEFFDEAVDMADTSLSLLSLKLKDENTNAQANMLNEYIQQASLEQYVRVDFSANTQASVFSNALEGVLEGDLNLSEQMNVLDSIQIISLGLAHGDHYHFPTCTNLHPDNVVETEFDFEGHDDHDHI